MADAPNTNNKQPAVPKSGSAETKPQSADDDAAQSRGQADEAGSPQEGPPQKRRTWVRPLLWGLLALALLIGIPWGLNYWHYARTHVSTDDAYVTGNLTSVSPIISGTLNALMVDEGDRVSRGQLIARLDSAGPQASLRQAQANYKAALSQIPQAERNLLYQQQATDAAINKAQAALAAQKAKTSGAAQQVNLASGTTRNQIKQAQAQIQQAEAQAQQAQAQARAADLTVENDQVAIQTALAALENYQQQVQTAQKAVQAAQAHVAAAQADAERATKDEARYRVLYAQDAVAAQVYDNARAQARNAQATLLANQSQVEEAQSQVVQAQDSVKQAQSQVEQARKNVAQAQAQAHAAHRAADAVQEQVGVARAGLGLAQANGLQIDIQQSNLRSTTQQTGESEADVATARAGQEQVEVRRTQIDTYRAQAQQAQAALTNAQVTLDDTNIYAPSDGTIVTKTANVGASLSPGQPIVTMTQGQYVWVEANYKETQLNDVVPGEPVEITVDAFPGKIFKGQVRSIKEATGAATSLLPPDNSTGNFTKVVQRVPVRIELIAAGENEDAKYARRQDLLNLRQGMSVVATIDTTEADKYRRQANGAQSGARNGSFLRAGGSPGAGEETPGTANAGGANAEGMSNPPVNGPGETASPGSSHSGGGTQPSGPAGNPAPGAVNGMSGQNNGQNAALSPPSGPPNMPNPGSGVASPNGQSASQSGSTTNGINNGPGQAASSPNTPTNQGTNGAGGGR